MFIAKTDYTLNRKNKDAIVCKTAVGNYVLLKQENFASDEEFEKWKAWSDEDYHIEENATRRTSRKNVMLSEKVDNEICYLSAKDTLCEKLENLERIDKVCRIKELLTETQYRRLWFYVNIGDWQVQGTQPEPLVNKYHSAICKIRKNILFLWYMLLKA